jgi:hypothetical protein
MLRPLHKSQSRALSCPTIAQSFHHPSLVPRQQLYCTSSGAVIMASDHHSLGSPLFQSERPSPDHHHLMVGVGHYFLPPSTIALALCALLPTVLRPPLHEIWSSPSRFCFPSSTDSPFPASIMACGGRSRHGRGRGNSSSTHRQIGCV